MSDDLRELADSVFADRTDGTGFDADLWRTCDEVGFTRLTLSEAGGGSGGTLLDAGVVLSAAGRGAARVPLVESDLLGAWLMDEVGLPPLEGPLTAVAAREGELRVDGRGRLHGRLRRVPWARSAEHILVVEGDRVFVVDPAAAAATVEHGENLAEEPRDDVVLDATAPTATAPAGPGVAEELALRAALGRSLLLSGASTGAVAVAIRYATERVQFGRPLSRLQAVQQQLAAAAGEASAATAAAEAAAAAAHDIGVPAAAWAIAAAKARCGAAAGTVARTSHQVLGALGFTREHHLRLHTTRLWAWRDEAGSDAHWDEWLGRRVVELGANGLWPAVVGGGA